MSRSFKFVAVILALVFIAGTLPALACVRPGTADVPHRCCPTMKTGSARAALHPAPAKTSCCDISSSKPESASVLMTPTSDGPLVVTPQTTQLLAPVITIPTMGTDDHVPYAAGPPAQSLLCIFLI